MNSWQVSKVNHRSKTHSITLDLISAAIWDSCIHVFTPLMRNNYNPLFTFTWTENFLTKQATRRQRRLSRCFIRDSSIFFLF